MKAGGFFVPAASGRQSGLSWLECMSSGRGFPWVAQMFGGGYECLRT